MNNNNNNETTRPTEGTNAPRREAIPINGTELIQIILGSIAQRLLGASALSEVFSYPGAKVQFAIRIEEQPLEEGRTKAWQENFTLDFSNPPDVVRILSGLPVWEQFKVQLDRFVQMNERQVEAGEQLRKAAEQTAGVSDPNNSRVVGLVKGQMQRDAPVPKGGASK